VLITVRDDIDTDAAFAKRLRHDWYYLTPIMLLSVTDMFTPIYRAMRLDSIRRPNPQPHLSPAPWLAALWWSLCPNPG